MFWRTQQDMKAETFKHTGSYHVGSFRMFIYYKHKILRTYALLVAMLNEPMQTLRLSQIPNLLGVPIPLQLP